MGFMSELVHLVYERPGKDVTTFDEWLVLDRPDAKVLLLERYEGEGGAMLAHGSPIVWYVFPEKWHSIGRFHDADENLTGWYTNFCMPVEMKGTHWHTRDLFLDLWQPVEGDPMWLDEDELADALQSKLVDKATHKRLKNERALIDMQVKAGEWPPAIARDVGLEQVRALKKS